MYIHLQKTSRVVASHSFEKTETISMTFENFHLLQNPRDARHYLEVTLITFLNSNQPDIGLELVNFR